MSYDATNWAFKQRGLKPASRVVLFYLCDRYHPDNGCFPSQETLAADCEISRSALNTHLDELEERGLIAREQRRERGSKRMERTRYRFAFEADFAPKNPEKPCPETGHGDDEAVSGNSKKPSPENGESRVQNPDSNPVREPVIEPVNEREGVREAPDRRKRIEREFWKLVKNWPGFEGMGKQSAMKPFFELSDEERELASRRFQPWLALLKAQKKQHTPAPSTYFTEKLFLDVPDVAPEAAKPEACAPFSKGWMALWLCELMRPMETAFPPPTPFQRIEMRDADKARRINRERRQRHGWPKAREMAEELKPRIVPPEIAALGESFVRIARDSEMALRWYEMLERMDRPWLTGNWPHLFLPAGEPEAAFEEFAGKLARERSDADAA